MKTRTGYLVKRGKTFYACWTVAGKKFRQSTHTADKRQATTELARIMEPFLVEDEVKTLQNVKARIEGATAELAVMDEQHNPPLKILQAWAAYRENIERPDSGERTLADYEGHFQQFATWAKDAHPEAVLLRDVSKNVATEYAVHVQKRGLSGNSFNKRIRFLQLLFRVVKDKARLDGNPWETIRSKRLAPQSRRELTIEELRAVCGSATGELRLLFALGLYTGLRLGDCATMRWGEIDLVRGIIRRIPNKTARRNSKTVNVPLHTTLRGMLTEAHDVPQRGEYVLPDTAALYLRDNTALCKMIQDHFEANNIRTHKPGTGFVTVAGANGKPEEKHTGKRASVEVGFHSLRHSFVSLCRAANAPLSVVESIVGHSSPAMTRHYTHTGEQGALDAVNSLPFVIGEAPKALPARHTVDAETVRAIAEKLTTKNVKEVRAELLALTTME